MTVTGALVHEPLSQPVEVHLDFVAPVTAVAPPSLTMILGRALLRTGARRGMCTAVTPPPAIVTEIRELVVEMKAKLAAKPDPSEMYSPSALEAALKSGSVDSSLLSSSLTDFDAGAKKLAMKCVTDSNAMLKEMAAEEATMADYDWSQWEKKGLDKETIAEVKSIMDTFIAAEAANLPDLIKENDLEGMTKEVKTAFEGPGGFLEEAGNAEKAATAAMEQVVADLETLEMDAVGLRDVTVAEILEREPALREEMEEEIRNSNWGY